MMVIFGDEYLLLTVVGISYSAHAFMVTRR